MRELYTTVASKLIFPLHERLKGHDSVSRMRSLERSQWWDRETLEAERLAKLRAFLSDVGEHCSYYRQLFGDCGFSPRTMSAVADLERIPCLTKSEIRTYRETIKSARTAWVKQYNTGGSSGEPLIFLIGKDRISHDVAAKWRATRWWDVDIGDREIVVWGSPIEVGAQDRVRLLRDRLLRTRLLPAFEMSPKNLDAFVAEIRRFAPRMLFGYPSALAHIARHAGERGVRLDDIGVRVAFVTSEKLYDHQRSAIGAAFGCKVANGYGGRDAGFIAHECPQGGMHISAEDIIVETVDAEGRPVPAGESGEIVVTHMATAEFPFIRYRTGDIGILDDRLCACGRGLPLLREIQGRTTDFVVAQDGTVMHGLALIYVMRELQGVRQFKIVQETRDLVRVLVVTDGSAPARGLAERVRTAFKSRLGQGVTVLVERVEEIKPERSGKFRYVVSAVTAQPAA
jgi:phenylacetate-CoA ligase